MKKKLLTRLGFGLFLWLVLLVMYLPIFILVVFSFSETRTIDFGNFEFGFGLYRELFQDQDIREAVINTVIIATISAFVATIIGTMACVGILRMKRRAKNAVMTLNQAPLVNADIVTSFSLVLFFVLLGFYDMGYFKLILAHTLICLPIVILIVLPRMRALDANLFEAAQDLGAKPMHALFSVVIPQLLPAMITAFLLGFTFSLDDFIITQFNNDGVETISTLVFGATRRGVPPVFRALSTLMFASVIIVLIIVNIRLSKQRKKEALDE